MQKKIAILFLSLTLVLTVAVGQPQRSAALGVADFLPSFDQICQLAATSFSFGAFVQQAEAVLTSIALQKGLDWLAKKYPILSGVGSLARGASAVPVNDSGTQSRIDSANFEEHLKNCAQTVLSEQANRYATNFVQKTLDQYKIKNYAVYSALLAGSVY